MDIDAVLKRMETRLSAMEVIVSGRAVPRPTIDDAAAASIRQDVADLRSDLDALAQEFRSFVEGSNSEVKTAVESSAPTKRGKKSEG